MTSVPTIPHARYREPLGREALVIIGLGIACWMPVLATVAGVAWFIGG